MVEESTTLKFNWAKEGFLQSKAKLYPLAIKSFLNALEEDPDNSEIHNELGLIYFRQNHFEEAIMAFKNAIRCNPDSFKAYNNLAWVYKEIKHADKALEYFIKALNLAPDNIEVLKSISDFYFDIEEYEQSLEYLSRAVTICGENEILCYKVALCYQKLTKYNDAIIFYNKALSFNEKNANCLQELSTLYYKTGDFEKSKLYLEKFMDIQPDNAWAYSNLGNIYLLYYEKPEIACEYYQKAYELDPNYAYALYNLGNVSALNNDYESALQFYKKACETENNPLFLNEYALMNYKLNRIDEAVSILNNTLEIDSSNEWTNIYLGKIYAEGMSDYQKAIKYLNIAKHINPENPKIYYYLAKSYFFNSNRNDAIISIELALKFEPDNDKFKALKIRIEESDSNNNER